MTQESIHWLNNNVYSGYGVEPWYYIPGVSRVPFPGPVPEDEAARLLPKIVTEPVASMRNGVWVRDVERVAVVSERDNERTTLQIAGAGYVPHPYPETLLGLGLPIATVGVLRKGGQAWVQYGNEDIVDIHGLRASVKLLLVTSADGSLATRAYETQTLAVCDNTLALARRYASKKSDYARHTRNSLSKVADIRAQYSKLGDAASAAEEAIKEQVETTVTNAQIEKFLNELLPESAPGAEAGKARTQQIGKREHIYNWLDKFSAYKNTELGLLQSVDAARRWDFTARGTSQAEAVWKNTLNGKFDSEHEKDAKLLGKVLTTTSLI